MAARILMKMLWLARLSRPDLYFITGRLATKVTRWTRWEDKVLFRDEEPSLHVYTDADCGSCPFTSKSTSGICVETGSSRFPVFWSSRKQSSVARSAPEAEAIAMSAAMFSEAINIQSFLQHLLGYCCRTTYHQDNETWLTVLATGYSAQLRHCGQVHRVNIASMSEQIDDDLVVATYCPTKEQIANGLTRVIGPCDWPSMLVQLGLKLVPEADKAQHLS